jgi:hypothetical protein
MPILTHSISSSSQNVDSNTSFGSELSRSKKLRKKSSTSDDDIDSISLSYSNLKIF